MSAPTREQALEWIGERLEAIQELRNASTRSGAFKQWRQSTLTAIQRIWPEDPSRSERFRRVSFTPPCARPDDRATRTAYERGCAEARRLLKLWIAEIQLHGTRPPAAAAAPDPAGPEASEPPPGGPVERSPPAAGTAPDPLGRSIAEALRRARGEPGGDPPPPAGATGPAADLAALAADLDALGVPPARRERVRLALHAAARELGAARPGWDAIRGAVAAVMESPGLARRGLSLLRPFLDDAA